MKKVFVFCLFVAVLSVLSGIGRTSQSNQSPMAGQFIIKASYPLKADNQELLATVYEAGEGERQKEILSIWSKESYGYELQYIRTAAAGQNFLKPSPVVVEDLNFLNISIVGQNYRPASTVATLWLAPDSSIHEVTVNHARELMKIHSIQTTVENR